MRPDYAWPKARSKDLVIQEANQETLVYDKKSHQAHRLNPLLGLVWRHCDGQKSWQDLAKLAQETLGTPNDSQVIELALHELVLAKLLLTDVVVTPEQKRYTLRQVSRRFGTAAAFLLSPLVTTASEGEMIIPFAPQAKAA